MMTILLWLAMTLLIACAGLLTFLGGFSWYTFSHAPGPDRPAVALLSVTTSIGATGLWVLLYVITFHTSFL